MKSKAELAAEQAAYWNGPGGERWLANHEQTERTVMPFGQDALAAAAPKPGERVLDIGCGTGATTAELARLVAPGGRVLGADISHLLIGRARQRKVANAEFIVADAATHDFDAGAFDLAFSRFGVMFFGDPAAAFKNIRRALKPLGRLVFVCWRTLAENFWARVPMQAGAEHLPPLPRPGPEDPGPFSFGDRGRVERILSDAGFGAPTVRPLDRPIRLGKDIDEALDSVLRIGPMSRLFADATPAQIDKAKAAIAGALGPHAGAAGVALPGACWLVSVAAP